MTKDDTKTVYKNFKNILLRSFTISYKEHIVRTLILTNYYPRGHINQRVVRLVFN